jgi:hypothetical protein
MKIISSAGFGKISIDVLSNYIKNNTKYDGVIAIENSLNSKIESQNNPPKTPVNTPLPFSVK